MIRRSRLLAAAVFATTLMLFGLSGVRSTAADSDSHRIVFIAGAPSHGYGSHEHYAGCRLLADTLEKANVGVEAQVVRGWPEDASVLEAADSIVIYSDGGGGHPALPHREQLGQLLEQGKGFVCLHYAVEVPKGEAGDDFLDWLGGYFETHWSVNPHWEPEFADLPDSPVTRGVKPFSANDEWYFHMRFRPQMEGITSILHAVPPESTMRRPDGPHSGNPAVRKAVAEREPQTVAWTFERPDGGRSFGFTGGHFHWNWGREDQLRLVSNAILWTAGGEVPEGGVPLQEVNVERLKNDQDYDPPENFDPEAIKDQFKLSAKAPAAAKQPSAEANAAGGKPRLLHSTPVVTSATEGHQVEIEAPLKGARDLFLVVTDGGDGFTCDWADWINPTLVGPKGELSLTELDWVSASAAWGKVRKNANADGQPLSVAGRSHATGIGTHADSIIHFRIPAGYESLRTIAALDAGGTNQQNGQATSVQFFVYADTAPDNLVTLKQGPGPADRDAENAVAGLTVADGLEATLVASEPQLRSLTNLDIDDRGRIWVIEVMNYRGNNGSRPEGDRILILEDTTGDGVADDVKVFYQGRDIDSAMGICVLGNQVIVSAAPYIWKFTDEDGDDSPDSKVAMFTETGQPQHDHSNHSFLFGPDGKLYWNVGNTGQVVKDAQGNVVVDIHGREVIDNGKPFFGGMPFRCDMDGSNFEVLAHNFRNNYETTVDSFGTLWQSDNDDDGNRAVRINFVMEHGNYGYRDELTGASWQQPRIGMESEIPQRHWHVHDPGVVPNLLITGAGSPTGICVYEGQFLPERFRNQIIHCDAGPNVVRAYPVVKSGAGYTATIEPVVTGTRDKWFRPADVCVAPDGSLFVTDWYDPGVGGHQQGDLTRGRLFRVAPPGAPYKIPEFDFSTAAGAADALRNPNLSVRYKAWTALHERGSAAEDELLKLWQDSDPRLRARALWLLGKIDGRGRHYVEQGLADEDEDIRLTSIRLAKQLDVPITEVVAGVVADGSPAVLREAAIALRFDEHPEMPRYWAQLAARYDGADRWYLEALGIGSDLRADECFAAWLQQVDGEWETPAGRDIVWRSRAPEAAMKLAEIIADPSLSLADTDRYFRAMEFHPPKVRAEALAGLLRSSSADERSDAIIVRAVERLNGFNWRGDEHVRSAIERHISRAAGTDEFVNLVKRFQPQGIEAELYTYALSNADGSAGVEAAGLLLANAPGRALLAAGLDSDASADEVARLLGLQARPDAVEMVVPLLVDEERPYEARAAALRAMTSHNLGTEKLLELAAKDQLAGDLRLLAGGLLSRSQNTGFREQAAKLFPQPTEQDREPLPPLDELASMKGDVSRGLELFRGKATCANCHVVGGTGKQVGPDLSEIGDKLSREALYVSILDPSAGISHNYENYIALLTNGQVVNGVMVSESPNEVTLRSAEAIDQRFPKDDIEEIKKSNQSMMPDNLHHSFDRQGLVDLVEYLTTLKKS